MNIHVVVLNWNGKKDTLDCLYSLRKISSPSFTIVLVDNGSTDDSASLIREQFPEVVLIETGENLGYAEGNNVGIRYALSKGADFILLLNNDTVVDPELLNAFLKASVDHPHTGIFGGKIYLYDQPNIFDHFGGQWNAKTGSFDLIGYRITDDGKSWEASREIDYACGAALWIRRQVFESVGLLEHRFFLIWEESDLCFRARKAGFATMTAPAAKLWHRVSASFVGGKPHSTYFWWRNRLLWIERNCTFWQKLSLSLRILIPEALHLFKIHLLKTLQFRCLLFFRKTEDLKKKKERLLKNRAALQGIKDYLLRRFGNGPAWIYGKG